MSPQTTFAAVGVLVLPVLAIGLATAEATETRRSSSTSVLGGPATCHGRTATIVGTPGSDEIYGTRSWDVIVARAGDDIVLGRQRGDLICGGRGKDRLVGGRGDDLLVGQRGDDVLLPGRTVAEERVWPGPGDDVVRGRRSPYISTCVLYLASSGPVTVDLRAHRAEGPLGHDRLFGVNCVFGSQHADHILGRHLRTESVYAGDGDDRIETRGGVDYVHAEEGDDVIESGSTGIRSRRNCSDIVGGPGDDMLRGAHGCHYAEGGEGSDRIQLGAGRDILISVYSNAGSRPLDFAVDLLVGGSGPDLIHGQEGRDILHGKDGRDSLYGGRGNDDLFGGRQFDTGNGGGARTGDLCVSIEQERSCERSR